MRHTTCFQARTYSKTAYALEDLHVIRSPFLFKSLIYIFSLGERRTIAGLYALPKPENVFVLSWRFSHGDFDIKPVKVTIPEGLNATQIADIFAEDLPSFDPQAFVDLVQSDDLEGYLFPDTYFFMPNVTDQEIITTMNNNFNAKIAPLAPTIQTFGKSQSDVIKMASILEKEVATPESRKIVAGILWKRIALGMLLEVDSASSTYIDRGLPPTPISNPGLESITDAITPTQTPYLYFLSDSEGNIHYATTLAEQDANEAEYLK